MSIVLENGYREGEKIDKQFWLDLGTKVIHGLLILLSHKILAYAWGWVDRLVIHNQS